ncbi:MAG: shikimate dehydrogenase [Thiogranum sp.]
MSVCAVSARDYYAVMGNPIAHSKSPLIHRLFAEQTGEQLVYEALLVNRDAFAQAIALFLIKGGKGLNITVPFKQDAWKLADELSDRARKACAVNTLLVNDEGGLFGDNTDGIGLVRDLTRNLGFDLREKNILVLGAGGAARGVLAPLLEQAPAAVHIANRTAERALELADAFADAGPVSGSGLEDIKPLRYDLIINATAAGLHDQVPDLPEGLIRADTWCYDMMYGSEPTAFMRYAKQRGGKHCFDGLGMLVEQAAESFRLWRGVTPDTAPVIAALRNS